MTTAASAAGALTGARRFSQDEILAILALVLLAAAARFAVLPFATTDGGDSVYRVWDTLAWLDDPRLITHGVWGPLHYYLIALALEIWPDPVRAPIALNLLFSIAAAPLMYVFVREVFGGERTALIIAAAYALYPIAIRNGVSVRAEAIFAVFLLVAMIGLGLARREGGALRHAVLAGIAMTLAAAVRYEAWMLIPAFAALLWRTPRLAVVFVALAMIHPLFWMAGNWVEHGDPLYSVNWATRWEQDAMGKADLPWSTLLYHTAVYPIQVIKGMSTPLGLLAVLGMALALIRRDRSAEWVVPPAWLLALICWSILRGALVPKINYSQTIGTLMYPFIAVVLLRLGIEQASWRRMAVVSGALVLAFAVAAWQSALTAVGAGVLASHSPVPTIPNQATALRLPPIILEHLPPDGALISDFYGWGATPYVALLTRLDPARIWQAPGAPNVEVDLEDLRAVLEKHSRGVMVLLERSRLADALEVDHSQGFQLNGMAVALEPVEHLAWPMPDREEAALIISRYRVVTAS